MAAEDAIKERERIRRMIRTWYTFEFPEPHTNALKPALDRVKESARAFVQLSAMRSEERDRMGGKDPDIAAADKQVRQAQTIGLQLTAFRGNVVHTICKQILAGAVEGSLGEEQAGAISRATKEFCDAVKSTQKAIASAKEARRAAVDKPDAEGDAAKARHSDRMEILRKQAQDLGVAIPWQIEYVLVMRDQDGGKASLEGGMVEDVATGKALNENYCALTGSEIQVWARGENTFCYRCIDAGGFVPTVSPDPARNARCHCEAVHQLLIGPPGLHSIRAPEQRPGDVPMSADEATERACSGAGGVSMPNSGSTFTDGNEPVLVPPVLQSLAWLRRSLWLLDSQETEHQEPDVGPGPGPYQPTSLSPPASGVAAGCGVHSESKEGATRSCLQLVLRGISRAVASLLELEPLLFGSWVREQNSLFLQTAVASAPTVAHAVANALRVYQDRPFVAIPREVDLTIPRVRARIAGGRPTGCSAQTIGDALLALSVQAAGAVVSLGAGGISGPNADGSSPPPARRRLPTAWRKSFPVPPPPAPRGSPLDDFSATLTEDEKLRLSLEGSGDGHWHWLTFGQLRRRVFQLAAGLCRLLPRHSFVGLCSEQNRPEWCESDFACALNHFPSVGMMPAWPLQETTHVIRTARLRIAAVSHGVVQKFARAMQHPGCERLALLVVFPRDPLAAAIEDGGGAAADDARQREADSLHALRVAARSAAADEVRQLDTGLKPTVPRIMGYGDVLRLGSVALSAIEDASEGSGALLPSYSGVGPSTPVTCLDDDDAARCKHLVARCIRAAGHNINTLSSVSTNDVVAQSTPPQLHEQASLVAGTASGHAPRKEQGPDAAGAPLALVREVQSPASPSEQSPSMYRSVSVDSSHSHPEMGRDVSVADMVRTSSAFESAASADPARSSLLVELAIPPSEGALAVPLNQLRLMPSSEEDPMPSWDPRLLHLNHSVASLDPVHAASAMHHARADASSEGDSSHDSSVGGSLTGVMTFGMDSDHREEQASFYKGQRVISLVFTSGSTGTPKGVVETEGRWMQGVLGKVPVEPLVYLSNSPLAHGMDRGMVWMALLGGGRIGFKSTGMTMHEGLCRLNPTMFVAMPHFWSELHSDAHSVPSHELADDRADSHESLRIALTKARLGRRLLVANTGGAPIAPAVQSWCGQLLESGHLGNNYGATECPGISMDGAISTSCEVMLRPLEDELEENRDAEPAVSASEQHDEQVSGITIRGEIMTRSSRNAQGYYDAPEETRRAFLANGWYATGDIGVLRKAPTESESKFEQALDKSKQQQDCSHGGGGSAQGEVVSQAESLGDDESPEEPEASARREQLLAEAFASVLATRTVSSKIQHHSARLHIVDRIKNQIELYHLGRSVWFNADPVERVLSRAPAASHVVLAGRRDMEQVLGVICAAPSSDLDDAAILESVREHGLQNGVPAWQLPQSVVVAREEWNEASGLLVGLGKIARHKVLARFTDRISAAYAAFRD